jgi:branched-chain amino acid transport system permease protein
VRLTWHYFAIITVIFSLIFYFAAMSWRGLTGGDDGLSFSTPSVFQAGGVNLTLASDPAQYYVFLTIVLCCFVLMRRLIRSPLGLRFQAVRENDRRAALIGINVYVTRLTAFTIAGALAGISGALFAFFGRYASASYMFYHVSGEAVVWAVVGGVGTLFGPLLGTAVLITFRELVSGIWEHYLIAVGAITILIVMYLPRGIAGLVEDGIAACRRTLPGPASRAQPAEDGRLPLEKGRAT